MAKLTNREKAYRLVERELRRANIREVHLWRAAFYLLDGAPANVTVHCRGGPETGGQGLLGAVDAERDRQRDANARSKG